METFFSKTLLFLIVDINDQNNFNPMRIKTREIGNTCFLRELENDIYSNECFYFEDRCKNLQMMKIYVTMNI